MNQIFEFEIEGKTIGFKFGTLAFGFAEQLSGQSTKQIHESLKAGSTMSILHVLYGAAAQYAENKRLPKDFTLDTVSDWIPVLGYDAVYDMIAKGLYQYEPKNSESPAKTGELITA